MMQEVKLLSERQEVLMWSARDRTVIARTKLYVEESKKVKVEVEEL